MNLMETMERTLQTSGQSGHTRMVPPRPRKMRWPAWMRGPIDGVLHGRTLRDRRFMARSGPERERMFKIDPTGFFLD